MTLRLALSIIALALAASAAAAQETHLIGASSRGRVADASVRLAAQDLAREIGLDCQVAEAVPLGRDQNGALQFEVSCEKGPGYRLVGGTVNEAFNCLALAAQPANGSRRASTCRLPANDNGAEVVAELAQEAGVTCRIDEGAMVGLSSSRMPIYEAGCAGEAGAWIEQTASGWQVTDCLAIAARGGACRFTTSAEQLSTFRGWLAGGAAGQCDPTAIRYMGDSTHGAIYEAACRTGDGVVVRLDAARTVLEAIPCPAAHIGDGCRLGRP